MITLPKKIHNEVVAYLKTCYPQEGCGFLVGTKEKMIFVPVKNEHHDPQNHTRVTGWDIAEDLGEVIAFVHSHPDASCEPSEADKVQCEIHGIPWLIVSLPHEELAWLTPCGYTAPILQRPFVYGVFDCATLMRDWHKQEMNIEYEVEDSDWEWWLTGQNHYVERLPTYGFSKLDDPSDIQRGDVILMQIKSKVPNHGAVYLGDGVMLHHPVNHLSRRDLYMGAWMDYTVSVWRHKDAPGFTLREDAPEVR